GRGWPSASSGFVQHGVNLNDRGPNSGRHAYPYTGPPSRPRICRRSPASRPSSRLPCAVFSLYALFMPGDDRVTDEQIQEWADQAEAGYDVEELKCRGRGRPGRGAEPMQVIAVRLTAEEIAALDAYAAREHLSRSAAIRRALAGYAA